MLISVSGDVHINSSKIAVLVIKTVSGDIDFRTSAIEKDDIRTISGDIKRSENTVSDNENI